MTVACNNMIIILNKDLFLNWIKFYFNKQRRPLKLGRKTVNHWFNQQFKKNYFSLLWTLKEKSTKVAPTILLLKSEKSKTCPFHQLFFS